MPRSINNSDARRSLDSRFPVLNFPNIVRLTANDKDFSLAHIAFGTSPEGGEASHYGANNFLNLIALPERGSKVFAR